MALNNFRGYITAKDSLRRPKIVTFFLSGTLAYSRPIMQVDTLAMQLIARLVLSSVSGQNLFNGGVIIILVFM